MICLRTMCFAICVIFMILRIWCVVLHALKATPHHCWVLFWHNKPQSFCHFINTDTGISDFHNLTGVISKAYAPQSNRRMITYRSMKNFNQSNFSRDIDLIPLHVCEIFDDVNDVAWAQQNLLFSVIDSHAPVKRRCVRENQVPYMNGELRKAIHQRNMWRTKHFKNKRDTAARDKYVSCRNKVVKLMKSSVNNHFRKQCEGPCNSVSSQQ